MYVSLLVRLRVEITIKRSQHLRHSSQPPREAASWNIKTIRSVGKSRVSLLVRLRVEIICYWNFKKLPHVSLLVRLRVEMQFARIHGTNQVKSASSWGCELKYKDVAYMYQAKGSASSWGCELKYRCCWHDWEREGSASSWGCELKYRRISSGIWNIRSASSWGCELK